MTTRFHFLQEGLIAQCVFDLFYGPGTDLIDAKTAIWDNLKAQTASDVTLERITLDGTGNELVVAENGAIGSDAVPPTCAFLVAKVTVLGRNGRFFWPGIPENNVQGNGRLTAGAQTAFQAALDQAKADLDTAGVTLRVERAAGGVDPVDSFLLKPYIGTQRRRLHN